MTIEIHTNKIQLDHSTVVNQLRRYHEMLMAAHLRGLHPYGSMRKDCPLCVQIDKALGD